MQFNKKNLPFKPVTETEFERFTTALDVLFQKNDTGSSEENYKINFVEFLHHIFQNKNHINALPLDGNMGIDLAIHLDKSGKSKAGVHFEIKKPSNVSEMISCDNLNSKAFHESVLYFLFDKITNKNDESKHIIISNLEDFYIFDTTEFTRLFYRDNKAYSNEFEAWKNGKRNDPTTRHIYDFIAEKMMQDDKTIHGYHIRLAEYRTHLRTLREAPDDEKARTRLAQLCHVFSPQFLLKKSDINDSNTLNKDFYHELLHIIGLKEVKVKGKKLIKRKPTAEREYASMLENTIGEIKAEGITTNEDEQFDIALELCLTWVNRILFLKLLESQLYQYNNEDDEYKFLAHSKISGYDQLKTLFFQVLAVQPQEREAHIKDQYAKIPYLNSSLFEPTKLERKAVRISSLKDNFGLSIHPKTKLQDRFADGKCPTLEYLLRFLDAYDFGAVGKQELIRDENKTLINAAVLGLIFEKINGYKEGSFYTPGFVTMYMCRETIRRAALQKINNQLDWKCKDLREVRDKIDSRPDRKAVNETINTLTICDPAVGSGHFLVSALNEIIALKAELRVILDSEGNRVKCHIEIDNDELQVKDEDELPFTYHLNPKGKIIQDKQAIQQALFREKQTIIENCLFGVDINPNSVKICRLRLWIELLKNTFYTSESNYFHLETLPNIDINIKQGNSLISRFPLDQDLQSVFKKKAYKVKTYKEKVVEYRRTRNRDKKDELTEYLKEIKEQFKSSLFEKDITAISKLRGEIYILQNPNELFEGVKVDKKKIAEKKAKLARLEQQKQDVEANKSYTNAFEWRFEFPEVLDSDGTFIGFDVIISNPPYIRHEEIKEIKPHLEKRYKTFQGTADIFVYFFELGINNLNESGVFSFIVANKWMRAGYGKKLRKWLKNNRIIEIIDFGDLPVFEEATTYPCVITIQKAQEAADTYVCNVDTLEFDDLHKYTSEKGFNIKTNHLQDNSWILIDEKVFKLLEKLKRGKKTLGEYVKGQIYRGVLTGLNEAFVIDENIKNQLIAADKKSAEIIKPFLAGRDIKRYRKPKPDKYLIFTRRGIDIEKYPAIKSHLLKFKDRLMPKPKDFKGKKWNGRKTGNYEWYEIQDAVDYYKEFEEFKILYPNICKRPEFSIDEDFYYTNQKCFIIPNGTKNLLGLLNSRLYYFLFENILPKLRGGFYEPSYKYFKDFPVVECSDNKELTQKVTQILALKHEDPQADTNTLEAEIDQMVYNLYGLTKKEIAIIESAVG